MDPASGARTCPAGHVGMLRKERQSLFRPVAGTDMRNLSPRSTTYCAAQRGACHLPSRGPNTRRAPRRETVERGPRPATHPGIPASLSAAADRGTPACAHDTTRRTTSTLPRTRQDRATVARCLHRGQPRPGHRSGKTENGRTNVCGRTLDALVSPLSMPLGTRGSYRPGYTIMAGNGVRRVITKDQNQKPAFLAGTPDTGTTRTCRCAACPSSVRRATAWCQPSCNLAD